MTFDINSLVRTAVAGVVGLTITVPIAGEISASGKASRSVVEPTQAQVVLDGIVNNLTKACVDYRISKADTKLEREAKTAIDDYFGGDVSHRAVCDYVLG